MSKPVVVEIYATGPQPNPPLLATFAYTRQREVVYLKVESTGLGYGSLKHNAIYPSASYVTVVSPEFQFTISGYDVNGDREQGIPWSLETTYITTDVDPEPQYEDSVLLTTKKVLGIDQNYQAFDVDITILINSSIFTLRQVGFAGIDPLFRVDSMMDLWRDYLGPNADAELVKTYIWMATRLAFDPPATSFAIDAMTKIRDEALWRIQVAFDTVLTDPEVPGDES